MKTDICKIGDIISLLRKEKGITQEELGGAVGVSAQAVSKWECGGIPDTELLPIIADYFNVSLDTLFGREAINVKNLNTAIVKYLSNEPLDKRLLKAYELCWALQNGIAGMNTEAFERNQLTDTLNYNNSLENECFSQLNFQENGYTQMRLSNEHPYFMLMPKTEAGFDFLADGTCNFPKLFEALADENLFRAVIFLYSRREPKPFTPKLLEKNLGIDGQTVKKVLDNLIKYNILETRDIELDEETQTVYSLLNSNPSFISMLTFARELIKHPNGYYLYIGGGSYPFFSSI